MDLFIKLEQFYQLAVFGAIIQPPPVMSAKISNFVAGSLARSYLRVLNRRTFSEEQQVELDKIKTLFQIHADRMGGSDAIDIGSSFHQQFPFDFAGWRSPFGHNEVVRQTLMAEGINGIGVEIYFFEERQDTLAHWYEEIWTMKLYLRFPGNKALTADLNFFKNAALNFHREIIDVKDTVDHELIHMVQQIGNLVKNLGRPGFGLPPRNIRNPDFDPYGFEKGKPQEGIPSREHTLHEVEFYTNLHDAISEFKQIAAQLPEGLEKDFFRIFIGDQTPSNNQLRAYPVEIRYKIRTNYFFGELKKLDQKRWQVAVKRMTQYLGMA